MINPYIVLFTVNELTRTNCRDKAMATAHGFGFWRWISSHQLAEVIQWERHKVCIQGNKFVDLGTLVKRSFPNSKGSSVFYSAPSWERCEIFGDYFIIINSNIYMTKSIDHLARMQSHLSQIYEQAIETINADELEDEIKAYADDLASTLGRTSEDVMVDVFKMADGYTKRCRNSRFSPHD